MDKNKTLKVKLQKLVLKIQEVSFRISDGALYLEGSGKAAA